MNPPYQGGFKPFYAADSDRPVRFTNKAPLRRGLGGSHGPTIKIPPILSRSARSTNKSPPC